MLLKWLYSSSVASLGVGAPPVGANALIADYDDGIAVSADDGSENANYAVKDSGTPANDVGNGDIQSVFTNTTTSPKLCLQSDGTYKWSPHNNCYTSSDLTAWSNDSSTDSGQVVTANAAATQVTIVESCDYAQYTTCRCTADFTQGTADYIYIGVTFRSGDYCIGVIDWTTTPPTISEIINSDCTATALPVIDNGDGSYNIGLDIEHTAAAAPGSPLVKVGLAESSTGNTWTGFGYLTVSSTAGTETFIFDNAHLRLSSGDRTTDVLPPENRNAPKFGVAVDYDPDESEYSILREPSVTNRVTVSRDFTNAAWTLTNCTAAQDATGIDGISNIASTITATSANATVINAITDASSERVFSIYVKRKTGTGTVEITMDNGGTWTDITSSLATDSFYRASVTATSTDPDVGVRIVTSGDEVILDCAQEEDGAVATSPIPTYGSTVTRDQDELEWATGITNIDAPATLIADMKQSASQGAGNVYASLSDNSVSDHVRFVAAATNDIEAEITRNSSAQADIAAGASTITNGTRFIAGVRMDTNDAAFYVSGTQEGTDGTVTTTGVAMGNLTLGSDYNAANSCAASVRFYNVYAVEFAIANGTLGTLTTP